jgi:hypothetical protein
LKALTSGKKTTRDPDFLWRGLGVESELDNVHHTYKTFYSQSHKACGVGGPPRPRIFLFLCHTQNAPPDLYHTVHGLYQNKLVLTPAAVLPTPPALPQPIQSGQKKKTQSTQKLKTKNNRMPILFFLILWPPILTHIHWTRQETAAASESNWLLVKLQVCPIPLFDASYLAGLARLIGSHAVFSYGLPQVLQRCRGSRRQDVPPWTGSGGN